MIKNYNVNENQAQVRLEAYKEVYIHGDECDFPDYAADELVKEVCPDVQAAKIRADEIVNDLLRNLRLQGIEVKPTVVDEAFCRFTPGTHRIIHVEPADLNHHWAVIVEDKPAAKTP